MKWPSGDIPYAKEICRILQAREIAELVLGDDLDLVTAFSAPLIEARYKCFDRFFAESQNILELAVGSSVERGIRLSMDRNIIYVGTDLAEPVESSRMILSQVRAPRGENCYLEVANALSIEQLNAATRHFSSKGPMLVIHEGLWLYLNREEQEALAQSIRGMLQRFGGRWVTPDIFDLRSTDMFVRSVPRDTQLALKRVVQRTNALTRRDVQENSFSDQESAIRFLNRQGFKVRHYPMVGYATKLASMNTLCGNQENEMYGSLLSQQSVWVMSLN